MREEAILFVNGVKHDFKMSHRFLSQLLQAELDKAQFLLKKVQVIDPSSNTLALLNEVNTIYTQAKIDEQH